jgi:opacity protein-like surface antigen
MPLKLSGQDYGRKKPKNGMVFGLGAGVNLNERFSVDVSFYHFTDHKFNARIEYDNRSQKIKSNVAMVGFNLNIYNFGAISPFINAGAGLAHNNAGDYIIEKETKHLSKTNETFAWSVGGGINGKVNDGFGVFIAYRFFDLGKVETSPLSVSLTPPQLATDSGVMKTRFKSHAVMGGIKYNF